MPRAQWPVQRIASGDRIAAKAAMSDHLQQVFVIIQEELSKKFAGMDFAGDPDRID